MKYLHAHIESSIVDNSATVVSTAATVQTGTILYTPILSEKGRDGEMLLFNDATSFITEYGEPNFRKYGQTMYNALNWILAGGQVRALRVVDETAAVASYVFKLKASAGEAVDGDSTASPVIKRVEIAEADDGTELFTIKAKGKGSFGNNYKILFTPNATYADTYDFPMYNLSVYEGEALVEGPYMVALKPDAMTKGGKTLFIKNVLETYSNRIVCDFNETNYETILKSISTLAGVEATERFDILFGDATGYILAGSSTEDANKSFKVILSSEFEDTDTPNIVDGKVTLTGGTDGKMPVKFDADDDAVKAALKSAFTATNETNFDKNALQTRNYPIDVLLDANFDDATKTAMFDFRDMRGDCFVFLDTKLTVNSATTAVADRSAKDTYAGAQFAQSFTVTDTYTSSDIQVGFSYLLASKIPEHDRVYGIHTPMAGARRGMITGFKKMSFNPTEEEKETLYKDQINYAEQTAQGTRINSNLTLQKKVSALSNINNVRSVYQIIREVENLSDQFEFEFADPGTLGNFQAALTSLLAGWSGRVSEISGTVYQSAYDAEQKIARVRIDVVFKNVIERISIELNVGQ